MTDERVDRLSHEWDALFWCARCGAGVADVMNGDRGAACSPGVVGISHRVRPGILHELGRRALARLRDEGEA